MWKRRYVLRRPEGEGEGGGGAAAGASDGAAAGTAAGAAGPGAGEAGAGKSGDAGAAGAAASGKPAEGAAGDGKAGDSKAGDGKAGDGKPGDTKGYWPDDWRQTVSKEDARVLARLQRYASPEVALQALIAAQNRIASGELKPALGKNATPEELKEWRAAHGIPEAPDKYELKDVTVDEADKTLVAELLKTAHASNQTPDQVKATVQAWNTFKKAAMDAQAEADRSIQQTSEDALRAEWGGEFRRNINLVHGLLDGAASPALKEKLLGGRLADGTPIGSSPEVLKMLAGLALIQNPTGVVVPGGDAGLEASIDTEIEKIEKTMREDRRAYNKDEKLQARYRELLEARERIKPKK